MTNDADFMRVCVSVSVSVYVCVCVCERECTECVCASYECIDIYLLPSHHQTPPKDFSSVPTALVKQRTKTQLGKKNKKSHHSSGVTCVQHVIH